MATNNSCPPSSVRLIPSSIFARTNTKKSKGNQAQKGKDVNRYPNVSLRCEEYVIKYNEEHANEPDLLIPWYTDNRSHRERNAAAKAVIADKLRVEMPEEYGAATYFECVKHIGARVEHAIDKIEGDPEFIFFRQTERKMATRKLMEQKMKNEINQKKRKLWLAKMGLSGRSTRRSNALPTNADVPQANSVPDKIVSDGYANVGNDRAEAMENSVARIHVYRDAEETDLQEDVLQNPNRYGDIGGELMYKAADDRETIRSDANDERMDNRTAMKLQGNRGSDCRDSESGPKPSFHMTRIPSGTAVDRVPDLPTESERGEFSVFTQREDIPVQYSRNEVFPIRNAETPKSLEERELQLREELRDLHHRRQHFLAQRHSTGIRKRPPRTSHLRSVSERDGGATESTGDRNLRTRVGSAGSSRSLPSQNLRRLPRAGLRRDVSRRG